MSEALRVGAWLPEAWGRPFTSEEKEMVVGSDIDLLLVPENHDQWENRDRWKQVADELDVALYAGFKDGDWIRGVFYDPGAGTDFTYTKHSSAGKLALEEEDWDPETALKTTDMNGTTVGTTICHDHYFSPFMGYEGLTGASLLVNLSATPVKRKKWGEVLQARAIENCAYVVCTTHGSEEDGSVKRGNHAHGFVFDPFGSPVTLTELGTGDETAIFETSPDNIYTFQFDPNEVSEARRTITDQQNRPEIERIQESSSDSSSLSEPRFSVQGDYDSLQIAYKNESVEISDFESQRFSLMDEDFYLAAVEAEDILKPESLYMDILSESGAEDRRILIVNHWSNLSDKYHRNVVEPVLRARCVEWASPAVLVAPGHESAYQVWYAKNTSRMIPDEEGRFQFYLYAARGVSSAMEPVYHETERMLQLASACESRRSKE